MGPRTRRAIAAALIISTVIICRPLPADAQGEEITRTKTDNFTFVYRHRFLPVIEDTLEIAEPARTRLLETLGDPEATTPMVEVRFARNIDEMRSKSPRPPPSWADAVAFSPENIIVISLTTSQHRPVSLETVFRHELAHLALHWVAGDSRVPRWFNEGLAIVLSGEQSVERFKLLFPVAARGNLTPLRRLDRTFPAREFQANQAYAESADAVRFLSRYRGEWRLRELLERLRRGERFYEAMEAGWGEPVAEIERAWKRDLRHRFSVIPTLTAGMTLWIATGFMAVFAYVKRRRDIRRRIDAMADEDEDEEGAWPSAELRPPSSSSPAQG